MTWLPSVLLALVAAPFVFYGFREYLRGWGDR